MCSAAPSSRFVSEKIWSGDTAALDRTRKLRFFGRFQVSCKNCIGIRHPLEAFESLMVS